MALNLHGLARFTEALDIFIEPTLENVDRLKAALHRATDALDAHTGGRPAIQVNR